MKDDLIKIIERFIQTEMIRFGFPFIAPGPACSAPRMPRMHTIAVPSSSVHDLSLVVRHSLRSKEGSFNNRFWLPVCRPRSPRRIYTLPFFAFFPLFYGPGNPRGFRSMSSRFVSGVSGLIILFDCAGQTVLLEYTNAHTHTRMPGDAKRVGWLAGTR